MEEQEATELLRKRWPGAEEALVQLIKDMDNHFKSPWLAARAASDGPAKFADLMADSLRENLVKMNHEALADLTAHAIAPIVLKLILQIAERRQKEGGCDADDR